MFRSILLLSTFALSLAASAAGSNNLSGLKLGDTLKGMDEVSNQECTVEVLNNSNNSLALRLTIGDTTYEDFVVSKKLGIASEKFSGEIVRTKSDEYSPLITVEAFLKQSKVSGKRNLTFVHAWWYPQTYRTENTVDCDLK